MDPFSWIAIAFMALSTSVATYSYYQQSRSQARAEEQAAEYNRQVAENQAAQLRNEQQWAEYRKQTEQQKADIAKRRLTEETARKVASIRTVKGIDSSSGSLLIMEQDAIDDYLYDSAILQWETDIEKSNIEREASKYGYEADVTEAEGEYDLWAARQSAAQTRRTGTMQAAGSLLSGGAQVAGYKANYDLLKKK